MKTAMKGCAAVLYSIALLGVMASCDNQAVGPWADIQLIMAAICFAGGTTALGLAGIMARLESRQPTDGAA